MLHCNLSLEVQQRDLSVLVRRKSDNVRPIFYGSTKPLIENPTLLDLVC
jgi:hypothetical protein